MTTPREQRAAIRKALDTIGTVHIDGGDGGDGNGGRGLTVVGYDAQPPSPTPGCAWPVLRQFTASTLGGGLARLYDVYCVVRAGTPAISAQDAEALAEPFLDALLTVGVWTPPGDTVSIETDNGQILPAVHVQITPYD